MAINASEQATRDAIEDGDREWETIRQFDEPRLGVKNLITQFPTKRGAVRAVDGVSFEIQDGEILGLVGESGCGKTVTSLSMMNLVDEPGEIVNGEVTLNGRNLLDLSKKEIRRIRGKEMAYIFQDASTAFNPVYDVGWQVGEPLRIHEGLKQEASRERAIELMQQVGIPSPADRVDDYPHEFSGGMRQRAMIAMALACEPDLLIADEPTTDLDVTIEAQILDLLRDLREEFGMSILFITHDLAVIAQLCDRVAVMYAGRIVEYGDVEDVYESPHHPYTKGLLESIPDARARGQELNPIPGELPDPTSLPEGCRFRSRCAHAFDDCERVDPRLEEVGDGHFAACILEEREWL